MNSHDTKLSPLNCRLIPPTVREFTHPVTGVTAPEQNTPGVTHKESQGVSSFGPPLPETSLRLQVKVQLSKKSGKTVPLAGSCMTSPTSPTP